MELMFVPSALLILFFCIAFKWLIEYFILRNKLKRIPGPKSPLFFGISREIVKIPNEDLYQWFVDLCFQFKEGIVLIWIGVEPTITIRKPWQVEVIFRSNTLITKSQKYKLLKPLLGDGLITSTGDIWFKHRRLITPAFHFGVLEEYAAVMREKALIFQDCIDKLLQENPNMPVNIFNLSVKYTLDTICETAMGVDVDSQRKLDNDYVTAFHKFARLTSYRQYEWISFDFIYYRTERGKELKKSLKTMHDFTENVILQKQYQRKQKLIEKNTKDEDYDDIGKRKRKAFLDLLLDVCHESKNALSIQEIREEVDTFMFAGHDTTSAAISWAFFLLGNNPDVQKKVHEELKEVFGDDTEMATTKQLNQLKYMERVIKEVLRLYPSAPSISRIIDDDVVIDGHTIPKGVVANIFIGHLHQDPEVWEDPQKFDPDRFLPENSEGRHPFAYVPFSAGPRNCIGQKFALLEMKTALTAILRKWRVSSVRKPSEVKRIWNITSRPHDDKIEVMFTSLN